MFIGGKKGLESKIVPDWGFDIVTIDVKPMPRKIGTKAIIFPFMLISTVLKARSVIKKFAPDAIISTGGFASGPASIAAAIMRTPLFLQEQNSYPGITQRYASRWAKRVYYSFPGSQEYFKSSKNAVLMGNPVDISDDEFDREAFLSELSLNPKKNTIFITGGSQGAKSINSAIRKFCDYSGQYNILWQTGNRNYNDIVSSFNGNIPAYVSLHHFIKDMDRFYKASDIVIARAGALTLAEIAGYGKPSILVPYPYAAADHQTKNAQAFVECGAAVAIKDGKLEAGILSDTLSDIMQKNNLDRMKKAALKLGKPNALENICQDIIFSMGAK